MSISKKILKKRFILLGLFILVVLGGWFWYIFEFKVLPMPAYYLLSDISGPNKNDKILIVSPHPDDETLGAAGFIKRAKDEGAELKVVIATDGNKHGLKTIRRGETIKAMAALGVPEADITFLDYPDGKLEKSKTDFKNKLTQVVGDFAPSIVLSPHPADIHPDHRITGEVVDQIIKGLTPRPVVYQYLVHYHRYPRPEGFQPQSFLLPPVRLLSVSNPWRKFELTLEEQNAKNEAVLQYKSQLSRKNPFLRGLMLSFVRQNELFVIIH